MHPIRTLTVLVILIVSFALNADPAAERAIVTAPEVTAREPVDVTVSLNPTVHVHDGATAAHFAEVTAAVERFRAAGLPLPDLDVSFHADDEPCRGHLGLFSGSGRIRICSDLPFVMTHELAHAWERHAVSDETRRAFVDFVGLSSWRGSETPWNERGVEHAATTIQKVLMAKNPNPDLRIWAEHAARFEFLTGDLPTWAVVPFLTGPEASPEIDESILERWPAADDS